MTHSHGYVRRVVLVTAAFSAGACASAGGGGIVDGGPGLGIQLKDAAGGSDGGLGGLVDGGDNDDAGKVEDGGRADANDGGDAGVRGDASTPVTDAVLSFSFEDGAGSAVHDDSTRHNDGTVQGTPQWVSGRSGGGLRFTGAGSISVPDAPSLNPTQGITLQAWVRFDSCSSSQGTIQEVVGKDAQDNATGRQYLINQIDTGVYRAHVLVGGVFKYVNGKTKCTVGVWTHLAETYDSTTLVLYVNGKNEAQLTLGGPIDTTTTPVTLATQLSGSYRLHGTLDDVRIYPYARTAAQIALDAM